jgi:hypothetical protein
MNADYIVRLECGHEVDWTGPMTPGATFAQVCQDCGDWRLVSGITKAR